MVVDIFILVILLLLSGFFSSSELAFIVSNKIKIELRARKDNFAAKNAQYYVENPQVFFSTILISNNIINIAFASIITIFLSTYFDYGDITILIISTMLLLLFGELMPKYFARELPDRSIMIMVNPLRLITFIIYPIVKLTSVISDTLTQNASVNEETSIYLFEKDDLHQLVNESVVAGKVGEDDSDIVKKVISLGDQRVYEAMTPRTDIMGVDMTASLQDLIKIFIQSGYSKLPVYEENLDNIKGVVFVNDMYKSPEDLKSIIRDVIFVPDTKKSLDMLNEMLEKQVSIAVVVDEFGGTAGIVTVEDILEELFGEIKDEYDIDDVICKEIEPNLFVISGKVEIDHINEEYDLRITEGDYETIGGFITSYVGRIPEKGEEFEIDQFAFTILRSDNTKIDLVKVFVNEQKLIEIKHSSD
ncbi:MAG: HlyC/CorC family transporter [Melioribacteraceae bacterium]|nr:HlyC/CorC family transporter [Melioribacteraceae bacterium]